LPPSTGGQRPLTAGIFYGNQPLKTCSLVPQDERGITRRAINDLKSMFPWYKILKLFDNQYGLQRVDGPLRKTDSRESPVLLTKARIQAASF
jgi:hypothetical protein